MNEEKKEIMEPEQKEKNSRRSRKGIMARVMVFTLVFALAVCPTALAENETGLAAVTAQASTVSTWVSSVFDMITGNPYLALMMAFGLVIMALRVFRKAKRVAR